MNVVMLNVVLVLSMFVVDIASLNCRDLPSVAIPSIQELSENSPYVYDYSLTTTFDCSTKVFTNPARGDTGYTGTALSINGSHVIVFDYVLQSDGITCDVTICETGFQSAWYIAAYESGADGTFFCLYTCNGNVLAEFICASNNNGASPQEKQTVDNANQVLKDGLSQIHDARKNCLGHIACKVF